jgi:hypothetical protein
MSCIMSVTISNEEKDNIFLRNVASIFFDTAPNH